MKQWSNETMKTGFTFLEVIVAISVVTIGIIGVLIAVQYTINAVTFSTSRFTAAYLVQEGIEIVRSIRDDNFIAQRRGESVDWDYNLSSGNYEADYDDRTLDSYQGRLLKINNKGFYNYVSGDNTIFKRKITIDNKQDLDGETGFDKMTVTTTVFWEVGGKNYELSAREDLYNWR